MTVRMSRSSRVRPYAITGGRTQSRRALLLETLVSVQHYDQRLRTALLPEAWEIYTLCRRQQSITEISTQLHIPLGVVRVLVGDLAEQGKIRVHPTGSAAIQSQRELLERVLRGLQSVS